MGAFKVTTPVPISTIIPTRNRDRVFARTLASTATQEVQPAEIIVVDASDNDATEIICSTRIDGLLSRVRYFKAITAGAAVQRNQAFEHISQPFVLFCDDDILFERGCLKKLWSAVEKDASLGGVCSLITNCHYTPPGRLSRALFQFLNSKPENSYAGKCIGPVLNLLPEDRADLPEVVPVEWMNSTCTLYRRAAMPDPPFPTHFVGYSLMEDVTLSLRVGKSWKLANARTAKIFHDSQPGDHKSDPAVLAKMDLVNRHYVMTQVLERTRLSDYIKLAVQQLFNLAASLQSPKGWVAFPRVLLAKLHGIFEILSTQPPGLQKS